MYAHGPVAPRWFPSRRALRLGVVMAALLAIAGSVRARTKRTPDEPTGADSGAAPGGSIASRNGEGSVPDDLSRSEPSVTGPSNQPPQPAAGPLVPVADAGAVTAGVNPHENSAETAIPGFRREAGAEDPGPGVYMDLYRGRSGQLSLNAAPNGTEVTTPIRTREESPALIVWVPSIRVQAGQQASIRARVTNAAGATVTPASIGVNIVRRGAASDGMSVPMTSVPAGEPHQFEYRFTVPVPAERSSDSQPIAYDYVVQAAGELDRVAYERHAAGGFFAHAPGGRIDPSAVEIERREGGISVVMHATIEDRGTYWSYAELWGGDTGTQPIAFARGRFEHLAPGAQELTLTFGGLIIRDSNVDGPYTVRNLRFMQVDAMPPNEQEPISRLPLTPSWPASEFH